MQRLPASRGGPAYHPASFITISRQGRVAVRDHAKLLDELRRDTIARQKTARSPEEERVNAIIDASFGEQQFDERVFSAWLALYGNCPAIRQAAARILKLYHRRLRSNLLHELYELMDRQKADTLAEGIGAMIDGLWLCVMPYRKAR